MVPSTTHSGLPLCFLRLPVYVCVCVCVRACVWVFSYNKLIITFTMHRCLWYVHKLKSRVLPSLFDNRRHEYLGRLKHTTVFDTHQVRQCSTTKQLEKYPLCTFFSWSLHFRHRKKTIFPIPFKIEKLLPPATLNLWSTNLSGKLNLWWFLDARNESHT